MAKYKIYKQSIYKKYAYCEHCGGEFVYNHESHLSGDVVMHEHRCSECGMKTLLRSIYPCQCVVEEGEVDEEQ